MVLNFESFANIVTALGGITMYFPISLYDPQSGLDISHAGCLHISGLEALALVRARHLEYDYDRRTHQWLKYDGSGDIGRIERVHLFLKALAAEVAKRGLGDPVTDNALLSAVAPDLTVDTTFGTREMLSLLLDYHSSFAGSVETTLPVVEDANTYYDYKGGNYNQVVFPVEPEDSTTIADFLGEHPSLPSPSSVPVAVVDGTGSASATATAAAGLRSDGFRVTGVSAQVPVGPISETEVVYGSAAHLAAAERVLGAIRGTAVLARGTVPAGAEVEVVTGSNAVVCRAPDVGEEHGHLGHGHLEHGHLEHGGREHDGGDELVAQGRGEPPRDGARATGAVPNSGGVLAPPTPASEKIPAYDPRACPGG